MSNCVKGLRHGCGIGWLHAQLDNVFLTGGDVGFAVDKITVIHLGDQPHISSGCGIDVTARQQNL